MRDTTLHERRRLYDEVRALVAREYCGKLTLPRVARVLASSPRGLQRAYAQFGETSFSEDLRARRLDAAAELLVEQPSIAVSDVARLVGLAHAPNFAEGFRRRYGLAPAEFRAAGRAARQ
jgi:AraC-like DNA-binding protein